MMIVRIRTNLTTKRIELKSGSLYGDLRQAIAGEFSIDAASSVFLSFDVQGDQPVELNDAAPLSENGISHGAMLYLDGRLEKREKSFIDGDGQVAHKGILFKERDPEDRSRSNDQGEEVNQLTEKEKAVAVDKIQETKVEETKEGTREAPVQGESVESSASSSTDDNATWRGTGGDLAYTASRHGGDGSPGVRAPDEQRRERLIDGTPQRDLRFASTGMYSEMSPAMAVAMALSRLEEDTGTGTGREPLDSMLDAYGNPGASGAMGGADLRSSDAGDDLAAARALAMSRAAAIRAAVTSEEEKEATAHSADSEVNEEVANSLRAAGVSEHDIMMTLRQAQDEQVAMRAQKEEWRGGSGTVNLTNNLRHRPRASGSGSGSGSSSAAAASTPSRHGHAQGQGRRPPDIDIDHGYSENYPTSPSAGQLSPLSALLLASEGANGDSEGLSYTVQGSPGLERARRSFHERLQESSSSTTHSSSSDSGKGGGSGALESERELQALSRVVERHLVNGSGGGSGKGSRNRERGGAAPLGREREVIDLAGAPPPAHKAFNAPPSGSTGSMGSMSSTSTESSRRVPRREVPRRGRGSGTNSGSGRVPRSTSPLTYSPSSILSGTGMTSSSSSSRAAHMDDSTAVSQARSRLLNLVTNNRDFTPGPLEFGSTSSNLAPVTSTTSWRGEGGEGEGDGVCAGGTVGKNDMGGLDELGVLLERLGHGANPTNTTATTAITTTAARDPHALVLRDVEGEEEDEALKLALALSMQDK